jgi:hypothetical protein
MMAGRRRKTTPIMEELEHTQPIIEEEQIVAESIEQPEPEPEVKQKIVEDIKRKPSTSELIFLSEEDKRLLKKYNKLLINKLGLRENRSFRISK